MDWTNRVNLVGWVNWDISIGFVNWTEYVDCINSVNCHIDCDIFHGFLQ